MAGSNFGALFKSAMYTYWVYQTHTSNIFNIQYLKEMEVSYTHSLSCLVSFLTGQHVATHLFGSSMAKTGCRRSPLVSPSLFESSVVFGVLLLKSIGYQHLSHTTLSHTIFHTPSFTHHLCNTPSFTPNFVTHHL